MASKVAELLSRNQAVVEALPKMTASDKFALLESLEQERRDSKSVGECQVIMDLHRVVEQDLWGWAMHAAFEERAQSGAKGKPLGAYMQQHMPLAEQLREIARDLPAIPPADRFTLLRILNEGSQRRSKPAESVMFLDLHQMTKQSLWSWMTQKSLAERVAVAKKRAAKKKPVATTTAAKTAKKVIKKGAKKVVKAVAKKRR